MPGAELRAVDCQAFAGGMTLGIVQSGFTLVGKREMRGGFGLPNCEANRTLLGDRWDAQACEPEAWESRPAQLVFGNPPCSGFSLMSSKEFRGVDSPVNACMHALVEFAARCDPEVVAFESVQQAYTQGRTLMQKLRLQLEERTGKAWSLTHVLHNAASVGGPSIRRRYFWVASRVPVGFEQPDVRRVPTLDETIGDLEPLGMSWEPQPYRSPASWWAEPQRSATGLVDGHVTKRSAYVERALELVPGAGPWEPRENVEMLLKRHWARNNSLPSSWESRLPKLLDQNFAQGFMQLTRWDGSRIARVVTGGGGNAMLHPHLDRALTHREIARIMGFPDDWRLGPLRGLGNLQATHGKGVTVHCGRWLGTWLRRALEGEPGPDPGELIGDEERVFDITNAYRRMCNER